MTERYVFNYDPDHPDGYAVACRSPYTVSGQWVSGTTRQEALANWHALHDSGALGQDWLRSGGSPPSPDPTQEIEGETTEATA